LLLCTALFGVPAFAEQSLTPHSAEYRVKISVVHGQLNTELRRTEKGFAATHVVKPTGISRLLSRGTISETSEFAVTGDGIRPYRYRAVDTISHDGEQVDIRFDWGTGEASGTVNDTHVASVMEGVAHDRVSIQYELMYDLLNGRPSSEYVLFDIDELNTISVRNIGRKTIIVPAGKYEAVGIQHQAEGSKRVTTLWCVEELGYLPAIIEQHRKGKLRVRAVLTNYRPGPASPTITSE